MDELDAAALLDVARMQTAHPAPPIDAQKLHTHSRYSQQGGRTKSNLARAPVSASPALSIVRCPGLHRTQRIAKPDGLTA